MSSLSSLETFQARISVYKSRFKERLPAKLDEMFTLLSQARSGRREALRDLHRRLHDMAGIAATVGFPHTGTAAGRLEREVTGLLAATESASASALVHVESGLRILAGLADDEAGEDE